MLKREQIFQPCKMFKISVANNSLSAEDHSGCTAQHGSTVFYGDPAISTSDELIWSRVFSL